ncbi:hypothetical protein A6M27_03815 [Acidithiobacillus thiooxidans]|jgi:hypothetical protein|uniref:Uncharacterized protein n=1 Tax=Acidithiobacillus thiooxidans TaxID=930 RepID=A0A1C2ISJ0_ACITH|nr:MULTISPECIES: hypothetical protein [Acidithiobacillus]MBU2835651.1 hypothetical protein [Acidithiobacillus thiooxidans]MDD5278027.1 hypothetical protein [Acidithiobacillus sp.]OCX70737.1 hypothetical protein A6M23_13455 [Acidithiobacillus thiooxidans]OCX72412.1 hypothetical protein A6P07_10035 [Acidithiobacillus thiooxidans]OCX78938.1 hypothetical protein A6O24_03020 [Acidithiobacillus thiooxidans]
MEQSDTAKKFNEVRFQIGNIRATLSNHEHANTLREETVSAMKELLEFSEESGLTDNAWFHASVTEGADNAAVIRGIVRAMRAESRGELRPFVEDFGTASEASAL